MKASSTFAWLVRNVNMQQYVTAAGFIREGGWNPQINPSVGVTAKPRPIQNDPARAWLDNKLRFRAATSTVAVNVYQHGSSLVLWVDGVPVNKTVLTNSGSFAFVTLGSGLDVANQHEYAVSVCNSPGNGQFTSILQVQTDAGVDPTFGGSPRPAVLGYGDSIVAGVQGTGGNSYASWLSRIAALRGYSCINRGIGGQECETVGNTLGAADLAWTNATECGYAYGEGVQVKYVIVQSGHNDGNQSTFNAAAFQTSYAQLVQELQAIYPAATLLFLGYLPTTNTANAQANRTAANNAIAAAVAANPSPHSQYVSTDGWIDVTHSGSQYDTIDGCHPTGGTLAGQTGDGSGKIVTQLSALVV